MLFDYNPDIVEEEIEDDDEEPKDTGDDGWGWYPAIVQLCDGDITRIDNVTKLNLRTALTWLSYQKYKINKQNNKR